MAHRRRDLHTDPQKAGRSRCSLGGAQVLHLGLCQRRQDGGRTRLRSHARSGCQCGAEDVGKRDQGRERQAAGRHPAVTTKGAMAFVRIAVRPDGVSGPRAHGVLVRMPARILIVEDEEPLTLLLRYNLEAAGYVVECAARGDEAELKLRENAPDLVVLDWMLPGISGIELCRRLRAQPATAQLPIVMLTARGEESERVRGLSTGADDYVVKPFSVPELLARIKGLLRRASPERLATVLAYGDIELDREKRRVVRSGRPVDLGPTEYRLLEFFLEHPGRVFSREQLLDSVWGRDIYIDERTVDVHIGRLRKLLNLGREQDPIRTVRGAGYALDDRFAKAEQV